MPGGAANQVASDRTIAQILHEGAAIVDGAPGDAAKGPGVGGRDDQTARLRKGAEADKTDDPVHDRQRHS